MTVRDIVVEPVGPMPTEGEVLVRALTGATSDSLSGARMPRLKLGRRNGVIAQVLEGVNEGERVVVHPTDRIVEGVRIAR